MIERLDWDSDFFNLKIGKVTQKENLSSEIAKKYDLLIANDEIDVVGFKKTFEETKVIFEKELVHNRDHISGIINDTDFQEKEPTYFYPLAFESGKNSRFLLDERFGRKKFEKLYEMWVINSINKKFADKLFFTVEDNIATGFVTVQLLHKKAKIGLIAVHPDFQGKGIGKLLLQNAEQYCLVNGAEKMEIPTQQTNINACKFYEKMHYQIKTEERLKHLWRK